MAYHSFDIHFQDFDRPLRVQDKNERVAGLRCVGYVPNALPNKAFSALAALSPDYVLCLPLLSFIMITQVHHLRNQPNVR
jgi:hypothetical protein